MVDPRRFTDLASRQLGLLTRQQLRDAGVADSTVTSWVQSGRLRRVHPGVFAIGGTPTSWRQAVLAAVLAGGPTARASHRCASALWPLDGVVGRSIEIVSPMHHRRPRGGIVVHESRHLPPADWATVGGIPVTAVERTLIDCARYWHHERLGRLLDAAVRDGLTSYEQVVERFEGLARRGRPGIATMRRVLDDRELLDGHLGHGFEDRMLRLIRGAGLADPVRQQPLDIEGQRYYLDFWFPDAALGIECDSRRFHTLAAQIEADLRRQNAILRQGILLLRYTPRDLRTDPGRIVREISEELHRRRGRSGRQLP